MNQLLLHNRHTQHNNDNLDVAVHMHRCTYSSLDTFTLNTNCYEVTSSVTNSDSWVTVGWQFVTAWKSIIAAFVFWIANTLLFQPPTTTWIPISVAVEQIVLFTMLQSFLHVPEEWTTYLLYLLHEDTCHGFKMNGCNATYADKYMCHVLKPYC